MPRRNNRRADEFIAIVAVLDLAPGLPDGVGLRYGANYWANSANCRETETGEE